MLSVNFVIAQLLGLASALILCSSYIVKNKKTFLLLGIFGDIVYGLSFVFVNSLGTGIITLLSCLQSTSFYFFEKKNKVMPKLIAGIFAISFVVIGAKTASTYWDIIPIVIYVWYTFVLYVKDVEKIRKLYFIPNAILIAYDIVVTAYASAFEDGFEATFLAILIVKDYVKSSRLKINLRKCATLKFNSKTTLFWGVYYNLQSTKLSFETSDNHNSRYGSYKFQRTLQFEYPIPPS
ncbi:MAG: YgjV family protein [Clostridia bacterium]|nr:YgjV family protein [Clostridia bacterium]